MQKNTSIIALVFLLTGFAAAYLVLDRQTENNLPLIAAVPTIPESPSIVNPFAIKTSNLQSNERLDLLENEISMFKQKMQNIEITLTNLSNTQRTHATTMSPSLPVRNSFSSALTQRLYNIDNLIRGGLDPALAEDIVRRKNSIELKRLALQDRANRENYLNTQRYFDELAEINLQDVTLREELGDDRYDKYLFDSKQNNRIRIAAVMLGSAAEQAGIKKGDIVLSYGNKRMFSWQELKDATAEGQLGEYVSISIYRNGEIYSYSVPRGPLGMQLGAGRLPP